MSEPDRVKLALGRIERGLSDLQIDVATLQRELGGPCLCTFDKTCARCEYDKAVTEANTRWREEHKK